MLEDPNEEDLYDPLGLDQMEPLTPEERWQCFKWAMITLFVLMVVFSIIGWVTPTPENCNPQ